MSPYPALRIAQLDSELLDSELLEIINELFDHNLSELSDSLRWQRICRTAKKVIPIVYYSHQYVKGLSPGQSLMGVQYTNFTRIGGLLNLALNHVMPSMIRYVVDESHNVQLQRLIRHLESFFMLANLLHFLYFLSNGGPSNLVRRVLSIRTIHQDRPMIGDVNFSNLNRELLGHSVASLIILLRPLFYFIHKQATGYLDRRRRLAGDGGRQEDGLVLCDKCKEVAVVPVLALSPDQTEHTFCNYCYYVVKKNQNFIGVKLLKCGGGIIRPNKF